MTALDRLGRSHCGSVLLGDRGVKGEVGVEESWYGRSRDGLRKVMIKVQVALVCARLVQTAAKVVIVTCTLQQYNC